MFDRDRAAAGRLAQRQVRPSPILAEANIAALNAGHAYGETAEIGGHHLKQTHIPAVQARAGALSHRHRRGGRFARASSPARSWPSCRCSSAAIRSRPASAILHHLVRMKEFGVTTFQAEDEIAAICAAIGASYAGQLGVTSSSGPGIALKTEAMGLAIMVELPLVIVNSPARRPFDRPADQDRAVRPLPGGLRPQRRRAVAGDRRQRSPADAFEVAIEAVPHRHPIHDPGDPAHRRLHRQRRRAVESARSQQLRAVSCRSSSKRRTLARQAASLQARRARARGRGSSPARPA